MGLFSSFVEAEQRKAIAKAVEEKYAMAKKEALREGDDINKGGVKFDAGKISFRLIPWVAVKAIASVLEYGAKKYAARNWEKGMDWSRPYDGALRHLTAWWEGEDKDPDTGLSHLWHAATNIIFLITYESRGAGTDDRPKAA